MGQEYWAPRLVAGPVAMDLVARMDDPERLAMLDTAISYCRTGTDPSDGLDVWPRIAFGLIRTDTDAERRRGEAGAAMLDRENAHTAGNREWAWVPWSFLEAARTVEDAGGRLALLEAVLEHAFTGAEPSGLEGTAAALADIMCRLIDADIAGGHPACMTCPLCGQ